MVFRTIISCLSVVLFQFVTRRNWREILRKEYLGRGFGFPFRFNPSTGSVALSEYESNIRDSITLILGTRPGERQMLPEFGCYIQGEVLSMMDEDVVIYGVALDTWRMLNNSGLIPYEKRNYHAMATRSSFLICSDRIPTLD